jgi:hypothetical protein
VSLIDYFNNIEKNQQMKKTILLIFIILCSTAAAQSILRDDRARGLFVAFGVGPRIPVSDFSSSTDIGYGFNVELAYTDNEYLPIFLFVKAGFEQYPGSQDFYEATQYTNLSTTSIPVIAGARYYFSPIMENIVLFLPFVELAGAYNYYSKLHQFKAGSGRSNYTENISKLGINGGIGMSMFMMEILASYNYFKNNQYVSLDLKIRLPLYITF